MHFSEKDFPKDLTKKTWSKSDKNINSPHTFTMKNKLKTPFLSYIYGPMDQGRATIPKSIPTFILCQSNRG